MLRKLSSRHAVLLQSWHRSSGSLHKTESREQTCQEEERVLWRTGEGSENAHSALCLCVELVAKN